VSELSKGLDGMVEEFLTRRLEEEYPVVWIDALYEKIRDEGRSKNMAIMVVKGIKIADMRQIFAVEAALDETEEKYRALFRSLKARGLKKRFGCVSQMRTKCLGLRSRNNFLGQARHGVRSTLCAIS
jgi:transposase-like protein